MPSLKRKDASDDELDPPSAAATPSYDARRSPSPAPSPKRRRCDVLEAGMSQLSLSALAQGGGGGFGAVAATGGGGWAGGAEARAATLAVPTITHPDTPTGALEPRAYAPWYAPPATAQSVSVTYVPTEVGMPVVLPGSVEEPVSPETAQSGRGGFGSLGGSLGGLGGAGALPEVSMRTPSWYEVEKDRKSRSKLFVLRVPYTLPPLLRRPLRHRAERALTVPGRPLGRA